MAPHPAIDPDSSLWAWLAHDLRFYREKYGLSQAAMGGIIGRSATNLSNCEAGRRRITAKEAEGPRHPLQTGGHFQRLLRFAQRGHDPDWFKQFVDLEKKARVLKTFQALAVPGLLPTPDYALAVIRAGGAPDAEARVDERMKRQAILDGASAPLLWALTTESVLEWHIGGPEVMRRQLAHLLEVSEQPHIGIRVIPRATGAYVDLTEASPLSAGKSETSPTPILPVVAGWCRRSPRSRLTPIVTIASAK